MDWNPLMYLTNVPIVTPNHGFSSKFQNFQFFPLTYSKLGPRRANNQGAGAAQQQNDKDQPGSSSQQQQPRFQFAATPINGSNIVAVSSAPQQGLVAAGRQQQGQKPIQVNF